MKKDEFTENQKNNAKKISQKVHSEGKWISNEEMKKQIEEDSPLLNLRDCWFKEGKNYTPQKGKFHNFSQNFEEFQSGPVQYPVAIVETVDGVVFIVEAKYVSFSDEPKFSR